MAKFDTDLPQFDPPSSIAEELYKNIKNRKLEPELPTGIKPVDDTILGFHRKQVTVIAARPGEGKSSFAAFAAFNLARQGKNVLYLSLEMARTDITERLMCNYCDIDGDNMRRGILPDDFEERYQAFRQEFGKTNLRITEGWGYEFSELTDIIKFCSSGKSPVKPDVIFIDHLQRINPKGYTNRRDALIDYINSLDRMALRENVAIVALSQLNREAAQQGQRPSLHHLRETGAIEETASTVLMLWWKTMDRDKDPNDTSFKVIVGKQRHGAAGMEIPINFHANKSRFSWAEQGIFQPGQDS